MRMVSMKKDGDDSLTEYSAPNYGGGLCLYLNEDQCEVLGISKALRPGTQVTIRAQALVTTSSASLERDGDDKGDDLSLSLQITDMGMDVGGVLRNAADILYGEG